MAEDKKDKAPSFSKLLRGSASYSESTPKGPKIVETSAAANEEKERRRRPIFLPFARKEGEQVLFSLSYKEWAFLLGAMLLLFGGMAVIRMMGPSEPAVPEWAQVAELAPADEGSRPPAGGEGAEDVVTQLKARDTTRLVAPPSGMGVEEKKEDKSPLKDVFRDGLRAAEKESPPRPRLPGMLGALSAALGGLSGGSSTRDRSPLSPEEIDARLKGISNKGSRGEQGLRLGYSGAQKVPGLTVGKRSREQSDADSFGKSRQAAQDDLNKQYGGAEKAAAEAGKAFGESPRGSSEAQGATTGGGDTPRQDGGSKGDINYSLQRQQPHYPPWAKEEWETNRPIKDVLRHGFNKGSQDGVAKVFGEGIGGGLVKVIEGGAERLAKTLWDDGPPPPPAFEQWVAKNCLNNPVPKGYSLKRLEPNPRESVGEITLPNGKKEPIFHFDVISEGKLEGQQGKEKTSHPAQHEAPCYGNDGKPVSATIGDMQNIVRRGSREFGETKDPALVAKNESGGGKEEDEFSDLRSYVGDGKSTVKPDRKDRMDGGTDNAGVDLDSDLDQPVISEPGPGR